MVRSMESLRVGLGGAVQPVSQQISIQKITLEEKVKGLDFPPVHLVLMEVEVGHCLQVHKFPPAG